MVEHQKEEGGGCLSFYTALVEFYTEEFLWGFLPCGFPEENLCVLLLLCFCACYSSSDILVYNCLKISYKQFLKKIQHGIRATLKGDTAHLGFAVLNKSLNSSTIKEGSSNFPLKGASFYGDKIEFQ